MYPFSGTEKTGKQYQVPKVPKRRNPISSVNKRCIRKVTRKWSPERWKEEKDQKRRRGQTPLGTRNKGKWGRQKEGSGGRGWKTLVQSHQHRSHPRGEPHTEPVKSLWRTGQRSQKRRGTGRTEYQEPRQHSRGLGRSREQERPVARTSSSRGRRERGREEVEEGRSSVTHGLGFQGQPARV